MRHHLFTNERPFLEFCPNDRLLVGSPGIGSKAYGRVYFKDIEVLFPIRIQFRQSLSPPGTGCAERLLQGRARPLGAGAPIREGPGGMPDHPSERPTSPGKVAFQSDALEIYNRHVELSAFNSSAQGIRAKVKWISLAGAELSLRGEAATHTSVMAYFAEAARPACDLPVPDGKWGTSGIVVTGGAVPRTMDGFAVIGFAAIGDTFVCEINRDSRCKMGDKRYVRRRGSALVLRRPRFFQGHRGLRT